MIAATARWMGLQQTQFMLIFMLCMAHLVIDTHQGALPAMFPTLRETLNLSYAQLSFIFAVFSLTTSVSQPLFGWLSDRSAVKWLIPTGTFIAPLGMSLIGLAPHYGWILAAAILQGLGSAAYHPEAIRTTNVLSGDRRGAGMAIWSLGGNIGVAIGPLYILLVLNLTGGLRGVLWSIPIGLVMALVAAASLNRLRDASESMAQRSRAGSQTALPPTDWFGQTLAVATVVLRTCIQKGVMVFLPFYYVEVLQGPGAYKEVLLTVFLLGGGFGAVVGGLLADRFGALQVLRGSYLALVPLLPLLLWAKGMSVFAVLFVTGAAQASAFMLAMVLGQQYMPRNASLAAALTNGVALGIGGALISLIGVIADLTGVTTALLIVVLLPIPALLLAMRLPPVPRMTAQAEA